LVVHDQGFVLHSGSSFLAIFYLLTRLSLASSLA
jgi:hypothetical protein